MKKLGLTSALLSSLVLLASCGNGNSQQEHKHHAEKSSNTQNKDSSKKSENSTKDKEKKTNDKQQSNSENQQATNNDKQSSLSKFSPEEIEYARVWEQLGPLKNNMNGMNELDVTKIAKGTKVNPQAQNSAVYPENVVKLAAPMKAGGSVTYSSNGDGTINVYKNVPYNWVDSPQGDKSKMAQATKDAISKNIQTVKIKPTDNKQIAQLAGKIKYQQQ